MWERIARQVLFKKCLKQSRSARTHIQLPVSSVTRAAVGLSADRESEALKVKSRTSKRVEQDEWPVSHRYQVHLNKTDLSAAFNGRMKRNVLQNTFNAATSNRYITSLTSKDLLCIIVGLFYLRRRSFEWYLNPTCLWTQNVMRICSEVHSWHDWLRVCFKQVCEMRRAL